jgi:hypothetical protein
MAGEVTQVVEYLFSKLQALNSNPGTTKKYENNPYLPFLTTDVGVNVCKCMKLYEGYSLIVHIARQTEKINVISLQIILEFRNWKKS